MADRQRQDIYGLSTIDMITCGLGAAIVLMLFIASRIEPHAGIAFGPMSSEPTVGDSTPRPRGDGTEPQVDMASVLIVTDEPPDRPGIRTCSGEATDLVSVSGVHADAERSTYGFTVQWRERGSADPPVACVHVSVPMRDLQDCRLTYVTHLHVDGPMSCAAALAAADLPGDAPYVLALERAERGQFRMRSSL